MKTFIIFDNGEKTLDRFTIINKETGDIFGCSENPDAPDGAGKFIGNCVDHRIIMYRAGWRQRLPGKNVIRAEVDNYINNARLDPGWIGSEMDLKSLPANVLQYISRLDPHNRAGGNTEGSIVYMSKASENVSSNSGAR
jgi:hypothetical protein